MRINQVRNGLATGSRLTTIFLCALTVTGCTSRAETAVTKKPEPAASSAQSPSPPANVTPKTQAPEAAKML
jgi:hypothetical protein